MTSEEQLIADHEHLFMGNEIGSRVLTHWLIRLGHFDIADPEDKEMIIKQNIAKELLTLCNRWPETTKYVSCLPRKEENG